MRITFHNPKYATDVKYFFYLLFSCSFFYSNSVTAIVNIENMRVEAANKTQGFEGKLALDINGDNGNTQKLKSNAGARAQWYEETGTRFIVLNYAYGESSGIKDTDKTFLHFRNIWYKTDDLAWEAFTQFESNEFTRLKSRALVGGGIRWEALQNKTQALYLGFGILRSKEKIEEAALLTDAGVTYNNRLNTYLVHKYAISDHSRIANTLYYQPDIHKTSDYRLLEQFGLLLDVTESLSFKLSVDIFHDSQPAQQIKQTDTSYNVGFEYSF